MSAHAVVARVAAAAMLITGTAAVAQSQDPRFDYSITPIHHFSSDLDSGGETDHTGLLASIGGTWSLDPRASMGWRLNAGYQAWSFDDPGAFGGVAPWDDLRRVGMTVSHTRVAANGWAWTFSPMVEYAGESGASFSDSLQYGLVVSAARRIRPDLAVGLGIGAFQRIEDSYVAPFVVVNWQINERTRLSNPSATGPGGPAGIEISFALEQDWVTGFGVAYRSQRYRLDKDGPIPNGVGAHRFIPVYARIGREFSDDLSVSLYLGAEMGGELRVYDETGTRVFNEGVDTGATLGLSFVGRF